MIKSDNHLEKCKECKIRYPAEILWFGLCGICGLAIQNRELGINRKKFTGTMAEEFRQEAVVWRKNNKNAL